LFKKILRWFLGFIAALILLVAAMIGNIDRTPLQEQDFYNDMMSRLDTTRLNSQGSSHLKTGWVKVNITPDHSMPMAGYTLRDHFESVHDSLFARILVIENDNFRCAMVNIDLLIFPPKLRDELYEKVNKSTFLYLSATHTHNGVGGWDPSIGGQLITGKFSESYVDDISARIATAIEKVETQNSSIQYFETEAADLIENRVNVDSGKIDGKLRGVKVTRFDNSTAVLFTLSAHATSIQSNVLQLSADYPGKTISILEQSNDFAMFMSGMVGSHRFKWTPLDSYNFIDTIAPKLSARIDTAHYDPGMTSPSIRSAHIPIEFGPAQLRIDKNWKVNNWAFRLLFTKLKGEFTYLELGNVVFIGTPCDFSGEIFTVDSLEQFASEHGKHLIITSFNGDYDGYITYDKHYEVSSKEEINALNWVGPYYGEYFSTMIKKLVAK
jgi:neutral ceramidase